MVKNPKSKRDLFSNLCQLIGKGNYYVFPKETHLNLYFFGTITNHILNALDIYDDGSIVVTTTPDGESLTTDWLSDFSWSEIRDIYHIVKENIASQKLYPETKRWE